MKPFRGGRPHAIGLALLLVAVIGVAGCAIQPDGAPRAIPDKDQLVVGDAEATGGAAVGSSLVYLLAPNEPGEPQQLRSVKRAVDSEITPVLEALFDGPNSAETADDLSSAIPTELVLNAPPRAAGEAWILDVSDGLDELDAADLRNALAQIVATAAVVGVDEVRIRVNGQPRMWPRGDGVLTDDPLTLYDYPGMVESTQPPYPSLSSATR